MIAQIFRLEPKVQGLEDAADKEPESLAKGELSAQRKAERMRELTNLYGTKRSINDVSSLPLAL